MAAIITAEIRARLPRIAKFQRNIGSRAANRRTPLDFTNELVLQLV